MECSQKKGGFVAFSYVSGMINSTLLRLLMFLNYEVVTREIRLGIGFNQDNLGCFYLDDDLFIGNINPTALYGISSLFF
jgi:hypothetical protein